MKYTALCITEPLQAVKQYVKIYSVLFFFQFPREIFLTEAIKGFIYLIKLFMNKPFAMYALHEIDYMALWLEKVKTYY